MKIPIIFVILFDHISAVFLDLNYKNKSIDRFIRESQDYEFEPVTLPFKDSETLPYNLNCDDFTKYAINCTAEAAMIYNSSRMSPPYPAKVNDWCRAIRHLTNCAINWNTDCKDTTDSRFNEESIKGHIHVVNNICDDEWFLLRYDEIALCVESSTDSWETCYINFKDSVEEYKNTSLEWTHYEVHFKLCCARSRFRRCTLESLFVKPTQCTQEQAATLQKFSVIVSEGGVYQDCDRNMMYANCPGGDPRPTSAMLKRLMSAEAHSRGYKLRQRLGTIKFLFRG
ncbi:uncharacterized protein LOC124539194 [Vanessa cardui]|uniref:uncharacterized protein LOC124539194 n=1 Tax=Vanessa cardui TaxID=171605 RepID=UPI001F13425F|nr:uncharacterized protein LOC124539194 [Vanessa cardui]